MQQTDKKLDHAYQKQKYPHSHPIHWYIPFIEGLVSSYVYRN